MTAARSSCPWVRFICLLLCLSSGATNGQQQPNRTIGVACTFCPDSSLFTQYIIAGIKQEIAAQNATNVRSVSVSVVSNTTDAYVADLVTRLAGVDHMVTSQTLSAPVFLAALALPALVITVVDPVVVPPAVVNRTQVIALRDDQVGFLAGVLAGAQTTKGLVAALNGPQSTAIVNMRAGFYSGVLSVCPSCLIIGTYLNAFGAAPLNMTEIIGAVVALGPDVVWTAAGSGGSAILLQLSANGNFTTIGVDADEYKTTLNAYHNTTVAASLLSSSVKRTDVAASVALKDYIARGGFTASLRILGATEGCVELSPCHESCDRWTARANASVALVMQQLRAQLISTGVDSTQGYITNNRESTSVSVERPPITSVQHVTLREGYTGLASLWGKIVVFDGRWNTLALYDDGLMTIERVLVVVPPSNSPVMTGGHSLVTVTINDAHVVILFGGIQNAAVSNASMALMFACGSTVGLCTNRAVWKSVIQQMNDGGNALVPSRTYHGAASRLDSDTYYVAGGSDATGTPSNSIFKVRCTLSGLPSAAQPPTVTALWTPLTSITLPAAMCNFSLSVWLSYEPQLYLVIAGGANQTVSWIAVNAASGDSSSSWHQLTVTSLVPVVPCVYSVDSSVIVLPGATSDGSSVFIRPLSSRRTLTIDGARNGTALALSVPQQHHVTCAPIVKPGMTNVTHAGWDASLLQVSYNVIVMMDSVKATSTQQLVTFSAPTIQCDAVRALYRSNDMSSCWTCSGTLQADSKDDCLAPPLDASTSTAVYIIVVCIIAVFVVGVVSSAAWFVCRRQFRRASQQRVTAPLKLPVSICFVNIVGTADKWIKNPAEAAKAVNTFRRTVRCLSQERGCCTVQSMGDSALMVSATAANAMHFAIDMMKLSAAHADGRHGGNTSAPRDGSWRQWFLPTRKLEWPLGLCIRIVLHHGSPRITSGNRVDYEYCGSDIDAAIAARSLGGAGEIICSNVHLKALSEETSGAWNAATAGLSKPRTVHRNDSELPFDGVAYRWSTTAPCPTSQLVRDPRVAAHDATTATANATVSAASPHDLDDIDITLPDFPYPGEEDHPNTFNLSTISRLHLAATATDEANLSSSMRIPGMYIFNQQETQRLAVLIAWTLDALTTSMSKEARAEFIRRLCDKYGVPQHRPPATLTAAFGAALSVHAHQTYSDCSSAPSAGTTMHLSTAMLQHLDVLELRSILTELRMEDDSKATSGGGHSSGVATANQTSTSATASASRGLRNLLRPEAELRDEGKPS